MSRYWESDWLDIWESNWRDIESQIDSTLRVKLTRYWESNWRDIESQIDSTLRVKLTRYWESNLLDNESQIDSILRFKLTIWLSKSSQFYSNILQLLGIPGPILSPPVTQCYRSKWLPFFFQCWWEYSNAIPNTRKAVWITSKWCNNIPPFSVTIWELMKFNAWFSLLFHCFGQLFQLYQLRLLFRLISI